MSLVAAHLNDAGLTFVDANGIRYREPGYALLDDDGLVTGDAAWRVSRLLPRRIQHRYWDTLDTESLTDARFGHLSTADLVSHQLEDVWSGIGDGDRQLAVAVPARMSAEQLGLLLGICGEIGIDVVALVDAAVAATRRRYDGAVPVHIDFGLHSAVLTRLYQDDSVQVERSVVVDGAGLRALEDAWLATIAETFVRQSRFDPLHTAETEQALLDGLPGWLAQAAGSGSVPLSLTFGDIEHRAAIESLDLIAAAAPVYQRIVSRLRALYRADEQPALQLSDRAARLPGLADALTARVGGQAFMLEPGATARGLLARAGAATAGDGTLRLLRQLPYDQAPLRVEAADVRGPNEQPTHVLFGDVAYALGGAALVLGSQAASDERSIDLGGEMPGVSRRHCSLQLDAGRCVITDHSRYGTFLNGHRIDDSAVLQTGDLVRIGTPGFELRLIRTEQSGAA